MERATGVPSGSARGRVQAGLQRQDTIVTEAEGRWVMARLSELLWGVGHPAH